MREIPTEKELESKVRCVEVPVRGEYIAMIDERRKTSRRYEIKVIVQESFNKSDLKRQTAKALIEHKDYEDFVTMRTFEQNGKPVPSKETRKLRDFYSMREIERLKRARAQEFREEEDERSVKARGGVLGGDTTEYNKKTGLPELIE